MSRTNFHNILFLKYVSTYRNEIWRWLVTSRLMITAQNDEIEISKFLNLLFWIWSFGFSTDCSASDERVDETLFYRRALSQKRTLQILYFSWLFSNHNKSNTKIMNMNTVLQNRISVKFLIFRVNNHNKHLFCFFIHSSTKYKVWRRVIFERKQIFLSVNCL